MKTSDEREMRVVTEQEAVYEVIKLMPDSKNVVVLYDCRELKEESDIVEKFLMGICNLAEEPNDGMYAIEVLVNHEKHRTCVAFCPRKHSSEDIEKFMRNWHISGNNTRVAYM
ncbi:MAG: hypothetical protein K2H53_06795 [Clostridia bacterium]|nr:hypothetical protein [Clostridia bacterium]